VNNVGRFLLLNVPAGEQTINVQLIGYSEGSQTVTVTAGGTATVNFNLREQALSLEGVVVTGTAGQARRREIGNQISSVGSDDIEISAVVQTSDVLQGRTTGIQINNHGGQVGSGSQIRLRGNNSLTQSNNPLIYIDGVRIENNPINADDESGQTPSALDMINPSDIDRIEVVKGPAATTLYGTEASGGVIQIFTKRGSAGAPAWTFTADGTMQRMPFQGPSNDLSSYEGYKANPFHEVDLMLDDLGPDFQPNPYGLNLNDCFSDGPDANTPREPGCPENGSWFRNGLGHAYNLSVRGGGETSTYFVSGRWSDQQGVIDPQGANDYAVRANVSFQPFDGLDVSLNNSYSRRNITWIPNGNNASGLYLNVLRGTAGYTPGNDDSLVLENDLLSELNQWVTSASIGWTPNNSLSHRLNVGMDYTYTDFQDFKPWGFYEDPVGNREDDSTTDRNLTLDYNGSWRTDITESISSSFAWGGQLYEEYNWNLNGFDDTFAGPGEQLLGDGNNPSVFEDRTTVRSGGFFLQEQVGLSDRLFLTGGIRWDGFSTFGEGFGLAAYPKISAAYTISDESFFPTGLVEQLKLRAAWGQSGRAPGAFDATRIYEATSADEQVPAVIIGNLGNADLGPEVSEEIELGFEATAWAGRVSVDFTWYDQTTKDALLGVQEAPSFGTEEATLRNLGATKNWGTETALTVIPFQSDNLEWSVNLGYTTNDSEITDMGPLTDIGGGRRVGLPLRMQYDDILQNPGVVGELPDFERGYIGNLFPTSQLNAGMRFTFNQSLTLDVLGEGQFGMVRPVGQAYQNMRRRVWGPCAAIQDVWYTPNDPATPNNERSEARATLNSTQVAYCVPTESDQGVWSDEADFFRLRSATISYRLPEGLIPGIRNAQISLQGRNLLTFTDYVGLDPEAQDNGFGDSTPNEYYNDSPPRTFILNVTVNF
jgi:TonB-linked SusC/RagA family outer membrane protein